MTKYSKKGRVQNQKRVLIFSLCLLLSFFFWLSKKYSKDYIISLPLIIKYENIPFDKTISNYPDTAVQISFKSQGFKLLYFQLMKEKKQELKVDVSKSFKLSTKQSDFLNISIRDIIKENGFLNEFDNNLITVKPDSVSLIFENSFIKKVPVIANIKFNYLPQYQLYGNYKISPDSVLIIGKKQVVKNIYYIPTEYVSLLDVNENKTINVKLLYPTKNEKLRYVTHKVKIFIPIEKFTETNLEVPVKIKSSLKSDNTKLFPDKVNVSFQVAVKDYKKINSDLFIIQAKLEDEISMNENKLQVKLVSAPDYVKNIKIYPERVEFTIFK